MGDFCEVTVSHITSARQTLAVAVCSPGDARFLSTQVFTAGPSAQLSVRFLWSTCLKLPCPPEARRAFGTALSSGTSVLGLSLRVSSVL